MKGAIKPNHHPLNKYLLQVLGLPPLTAIKVSGIEEELEAVEMPDRTMASGGNIKASEVTIEFPMHHTVEMAALEAWWKQSQDPVAPTYKKTATLSHLRVGPGPIKSLQLIGMFPKKRKMPDLEMANEGELATVEYTFNVDQVI